MAFALFLLCALFASATTAQCPDGPIGAQDGRLRDDQFVASTEKNKWHGPKYARLNASGNNAWCAHINDTNRYIKVVLDREYDIRAVAVQGRYSEYIGWYVTQFSIRYRDALIIDGKKLSTWKERKIADGPKSNNEIVKVPVSFRTTEVMIVPLKWYPENGLACLRLELYGCPVAVDPCQNASCSHTCKIENKKAVCECPKGYRLDSADQKTCVDIDECKENMCDATTTTCSNQIGTFLCSCNGGLEKKKVGDTSCVEIDECKRNHGCEHNCIDKPRYYECSCRPGYELGSNNKSCHDIDECARGVATCDLKTSQCKNNKGGYVCNCNSGFEHVQGDLKTCEDIDECLVGKVGQQNCEHNCNNNFGSFSCSCRDGYYLFAGDKKTCIDIDECKTGAHNCSGANQECENRKPGFQCVCKKGFQKGPDGRCIVGAFGSPTERQEKKDYLFGKEKLTAKCFFCKYFPTDAMDNNPSICRACQSDDYMKDSSEDLKKELDIER